MLQWRVLAAAAALFQVASAHLVISYPGWRGNNLFTNGTLQGDQIPEGALGINWDRRLEQYTYPYGMQWMYPCGGMGTTTNRTKWPVMGGGAVAFQPGWFSGHSFALLYINMGYGTEPQNMSHPMVPVFQIGGPSNLKYNGTVCLPNVPLPIDFHPKVGDNATIQVIETAQHGAALYACVDITFAEPEDVPEVNRTNCFNSTAPDENIKFNLIYSTNDFAASSAVATTVSISLLGFIGAAAYLLL